MDFIPQIALKNEGRMANSVCFLENRSCLIDKNIKPSRAECSRLILHAFKPHIALQNIIRRSMLNKEAILQG